MMNGNFELAYLLGILLFGVYYLIKKDNRYLFANNFLLACWGVIMILTDAFEIFEGWYSGYLYETFAFYRIVVSNSFLMILTLPFIPTVLFLLNFKYSFRSSLWYQSILVIILLSGFLYFQTVLDTLTSVTPGWHTSVGPPAKMISNFWVTLLSLSLSIAIVYFKVLPEFRGTNKDNTYEALIGKE